MIVSPTTLYRSKPIPKSRRPLLTSARPPGIAPSLPVREPPLSQLDNRLRQLRLLLVEGVDTQQDFIMNANECVERTVLATFKCRPDCSDPTFDVLVFSWKLCPLTAAVDSTDYLSACVGPETIEFIGHRTIARGRGVEAHGELGLSAVLFHRLPGYDGPERVPGIGS